MKKELSNEPWAMNVLMDGVDFEKAGRFAEAENCYWEAFSLWRKHQGAESMLAQKAFERLINCLKFQRKLEEATEYRRLFYYELRKSIGKEHRETLRALAELGSLYKEREFYQKALHCFHSILTAHKKGGNDIDTELLASVSGSLCEIYSRELKRESKARAVYKEVYKLLLRRYGEKDPQVSFYKKEWLECSAVDWADVHEIEEERRTAKEVFQEVVDYIRAQSMAYTIDACEERSMTLSFSTLNKQRVSVKMDEASEQMQITIISPVFRFKKRSDANTLEMEQFTEMDPALFEIDRSQAPVTKRIIHFYKQGRTLEKLHTTYNPLSIIARERTLWEEHMADLFPFRELEEGDDPFGDNGAETIKETDKDKVEESKWREEIIIISRPAY